MTSSKKQKFENELTKTLSNAKADVESELNLVDSFSNSEKLLSIEHEMCDKLNSLKFITPIAFVYNPLEYAKSLHECFVKKFFENSTKKILFLGMNPGPWGMCQTGIVFGEKHYVKEWLQITGLVSKPSREHPKKKVLGLDCHRSEISGKKFWGLFQNLCQTPENFFKHSFIYNYCCLAFMEESGKNVSPPELNDKSTKKLLFEICDEALIKIIRDFNFEIVIAIGKFAEKCAKNVLKVNGLRNVKVYFIPHPSPRNAKNFSNWEDTTLTNLRNYDLLKYFTPSKK